MTWSCRCCTLINQDSLRICDACGTEKPVIGGILPKAIEGPLNQLSSAIAEIFTLSPKPPKPQPPTYNIDHMSPSISLPSLPSSSRPPPRPPAPSKRTGMSHAPSTSILPQPPIDVIDSFSPSNSISSPRINDDLDSSLTSYSLSVRDREKNDEREAADIFNNIVVNCKTAQTTFVDTDFPHSPASLGKFVRAGDVVNGSGIDVSLVWLRPPQMHTKDGRHWVWAVFRDPRPSDIEQGMMGDCWLLSAMAIVAERPDILEQIMITKEYNPLGAYQIRVCVDGQWKIVTVDDYFPCRTRSKALAFAVGRKNQLWVPLIEKALAKQLGSYERLRAGRTIEGLSMLTGASCETFHLEDKECKDVKWARLLSAREAGFIMGCSCGAGQRKANDEIYKEKGLLTRHAYSILDVKQVEEHRLLRLRNPWGSFVWNGEWSDNWNGWIPQLKKLLIDDVERETGAFWISYSDFLSHFDSVDIARVRSGQGWAELRVAVQMGGEYEEGDRSLRVVIEQPTEICFALFQNGARTIEDRQDLLICVHNVSHSGHVGELVARSPRKHDAFVSTEELFLKPGHYVVVVHSLCSTGNGYKVKGQLVVHSNRSIYGEQLPCPPPMSTDSLVNLVLKEGKTHSSIEGCIPRYVTQDIGGMILMVDNYHEKYTMQIQVDCSSSSNVLSSRGTMKTVDAVPPLHRQIIIVLSHFESSQGYSVVHRITVRSSRRVQLNDWSPQDPNAIHSPSFDNWHSAQFHDMKPLFF